MLWQYWYRVVIGGSDILFYLPYDLMSNVLLFLPFSIVIVERVRHSLRWFILVPALLAWLVIMLGTFELVDRYFIDF